MEWVSCALCGSSLAAPHAGVQRLVRCLECGLIFVNPRPTKSEVLGQYDERYFVCDKPVRGGYENYLADSKQILRTFERRLRLLSGRLGSPQGRRLLDVGCAAGFFLEKARGAGWSAEGLEVCESQALEARRKGFEVQISPLESASYPEGSFEVVSLWDVIEHFSNPVQALRLIHKWTKPGGQLVVTTPDAGSWMARTFRRNWLGFRSLDEHLYFFDRKSLRRLLELTGFEIQSSAYAGKYLELSRIVTRMRFYTRIGAALLRFSDASFPKVSVYLNPFDTMLVVARKTT
jgi:SAM-dependent methyltransferase